MSHYLKGLKMTNEDKANLARWFAVSFKGYSSTDKRRASALLNGLVVLTQRLEKKMVA
jgi:hypothetical protein